MSGYLKLTSMISISLRKVFSEGSSKVHSALASFAPFCYSQHNKLFFNATLIQSQSGVQQEDPWGTFAFISASLYY